MKYVCFVPPCLKATTALEENQYPPCFVLFVDVLHEDWVFQWSLMWRGMALLFPLQSQCSVVASPVIVAHCCFPCPSAYTASKCVVMVSPGCVLVCEVLAWRESQGLLTMWQHNKNRPVLPGYQIPKVKHESMFNLQQEGLYLNASLLMHVQGFLNRACSVSVKHPHALLLSRWLISRCCLTCRNKVPRRIKMWWVHPSFASSALRKCHIDLLK